LAPAQFLKSPAICKTKNDFSKVFLFEVVFPNLTGLQDITAHPKAAQVYVIEKYPTLFPYFIHNIGEIYLNCSQSLIGNR
jgi:hypothetical protein